VAARTVPQRAPECLVIEPKGNMAAIFQQDLQLVSTFFQ
jgi:hypothetical protein